jgi:hypothetical protein
VIVSLAVLMATPYSAVLAGTVFFMAGALVGLFKRLRDDSASDSSAEEDYGFSRARLVHTPLFSGLAAIGGVILFAMIPWLINLELITPASSTPPSVIVSTTPIGATITPASAANNSAVATVAPTELPTTPPESEEPSTVVVQRSLPQLQDIFSLRRNPFGIVVAAAFGLVPALLIGALQRQIDEYKKDLRSTEAPGSNPS